ncbi:hypothetical protein FRC12_015155 [Ceratobasidium sp. 428]|nr:hypothetical protein FRC12_015155 [Ceratobasidium sp. 428]
MARKSHKALQISEITDAIASYVDESDSVSLMYTSQTFFCSAIRYVWGRGPIAAQNLLTLLDGITYTKTDRTGSLRVVVPRPLPVGYFDRFNLYAPLVRELKYNLLVLLDESNASPIAGSFHSKQLRLLIDSVDSALLLPNLTQVTLDRPDETTWRQDNLDLLLLLLPPSLARLSVTERADFGSKAESERFFEFLGTRVFAICPGIQDLFLFNCANIPERWEAIDNAWYPYDKWPALKHLISITFCGNVVSLEAMDWISESRDLNSLKFRFLHRYNHPAFRRTTYPHYAFQNLRTLCLEYCAVEAVISLWNTSIIVQLEELTVHSMLTTRPNLLEQFFRLLTDRSRQLTKATLKCASTNYFSLTPERMEYQPHFKLVELFMDYIVMDDHKPAVRAIATLYPGLRSLTLERYLVGLEEFLQLPTLFPSLEYLALRLPVDLHSFEQLAKVPSRIPKSTVVSALRLCTEVPFIANDDSEPKSMFVYLWARFFCRWWPGMQCIPSPHLTFDTPLEMCTQVNEQILELASDEPKELFIRFLATGPELGVVA